ncbi:MAG: hypothetical protein D6B25_05495 [Desulfobulbaceae bacterium]|nr:MAG: hypothetical protein D6B25_05495 [Desulfobulbaceae bacterium]
MLKFLRDKAQSIVIQAIVVIIALVFIFWGVGTNMMNRQDAAILVNGEEISFQQFQETYDRTYSNIAQQFGGTLPQGLAESLNIKDQVINQLTQSALLRQGGAELGMAVSAHEVQKNIEQMVQFQDNETFNLQRYKEVLAANRLSPQKFEQSMKLDLLAAKVTDTIATFNVAVTDFEIETLYKLEKETVSVSYVKISPDTYLETIQIEPADLEQWYETAGERYKSAPKVKLTYLPYDYKSIGDKIEIDETDIETYYQEQLANYQLPEKRRARHILITFEDSSPTEYRDLKLKKANEILEKARAGEDFATLAQEFSEGPSAPTGGDLGYFGQGQMVGPFNDAVFAMRPGEISDIVETQFGFHIIKLEDIKIASIKTLNEVREEIRTTLRLEKAKPLAFQMANKAYEEIIGGGSLENYIQASPNVPPVVSDFFDRNSAPEGITNTPQFLDTAFGLNKGELSSIIETEAGYAILSATDIQEPEIPPLDQVKEQAEKDYRFEKAKEQAKLAANQLIETLKQNEGAFETVVSEQGFRAETSGPLSKTAAQSDTAFPQSLVTKVFALTKADPVSAEPGLVENDLYVYRFIERQKPETEITEQERTQYRAMLEQFKRQQLLDAWMNSQRSVAEIRIHQSLENM